MNSSEGNIVNKSFNKIMFVLPSLGQGGAERVVSVLANELSKQGYEISVLMLAANRVCYNIDEKINLVSLDCEVKYVHLNAVKRWFNRVLDARKAIIDENPDVVVSFMSESNIDTCFACVGLKVPVIVSERNDPAVDPAGQAKQLLRKIAYLRANGFVFQTPDAQAFFSKRIQKNSCIIFNPLSAKLPKAFEEEREKRIVAVGRLNKQKNYPLLLDTFCDFHKTHPDFILEIYGEGHEEDNIKNFIDEKGLRDAVVLKGFCKDIHEKIRSAAFFVMTSNFEGMPNSLIEAMAIGLPCISTDCRCGGPKLLINSGENGLLVPTGNKAKLLEAMIEMCENKEFAQQMGQKAVLVREKVDTKMVVNQWLDYVSSCVK